MENYSFWITLSIWGMVVLNYGFSLVLARAIAFDKGYPADKSLILGILGPLSLIRFGIEKLTATNLREELAIRIPQNIFKRPAPLPPYGDYLTHPRSEELLQWVAYDENTAISLVDHERENNPEATLDEWIDHAIYHLARDRGGNPIQYTVEQYE